MTLKILYPPEFLSSPFFEIILKNITKRDDKKKHNQNYYNFDKYIFKKYTYELDKILRDPNLNNIKIIINGKLYQGPEFIKYFKIKIVYNFLMFVNHSANINMNKLSMLIGVILNNYKEIFNLNDEEINTKIQQLMSDILPFIDECYQKDSVLIPTIPPPDPINIIRKGIVNCGATTCYFNSFIQLLNNIPEFVNYIRNHSTQTYTFDIKNFSFKQSPNQTIDDLKKIFDELNTNNNKVVNMCPRIKGDKDTCILKKFGFNDNQIANQQDAHDILTKFFEYLDIYDTENFANLNKIFKIFEKMTIICKNDTKQTRNNLTPFDTLARSLNTSIHSIEQLINNNKISEDIEINDCPPSNIGEPATRISEFVILDTNRYIIIHLKRFENYTGEGRKLNNRININYEIKISTESNKEHTYRAIGAILHTGDLNGGHYRYASLRAKNPPHRNDLAIIDYIFNDSSVSKDSAEDNDTNQTDLYVNCYLILYSKV
jgi:hypothetical protein